MTKHTPGPWAVEIDIKQPKRAFTIKGGIRDVARYLSYDDHIRWSDVSAKPEEVEANAHLISAAPELLDALENYLNVCKTGDFDKEPDAWNRALAAITKARGAA